MTLHVRAKMLYNVWSYDFYDILWSVEVAVVPAAAAATE